ncbi:MAG TPA: histidine phosphatase family protein [Propionibacteriaceae bacterium]
MSQRRTIVHLVRHGEVYNPTGVLYGRLPDYHLSDLGQEMALRATEALRGNDIVHLRCSPLERAQETMAPLADALGLPVTTDGRVIEAGNQLEGRNVTPANLLKGGPKSWWLFRNVLKPTWGESYADIVARMRLAMKDAADAGEGHESVIVSHQLPIWMARSDAEGRRLAHDPRKRECTLASITSFTYLDGRVTSVAYREPAADLLRTREAKKFVAGA